MINVHSIRGYDETAVVLLGIAKTFREKPDRKGAYTDVMNVVTPRILKNAVAKGRTNSDAKQGEMI